MRWQKRVKEALESQNTAQGIAEKSREVFVGYAEVCANGRDFVGFGWASEGEDLTSLPTEQELLEFAMSEAKKLAPCFEWYLIEIAICCNDEEIDAEIYRSQRTNRGGEK